MAIISMCLSDQAHSQGQDDPDQGDPLGSRSQSLIQVLTLVLAQIAVGAAGQSAGQAGLLAGLQQNDQDQSDAEQNFQNSQNATLTIRDMTLSSRSFFASLDSARKQYNVF